MSPPRESRESDPFEVAVGVPDPGDAGGQFGVIVVPALRDRGYFIARLQGAQKSRVNLMRRCPRGLPRPVLERLIVRWLHPTSSRPERRTDATA